MCHRVTISLHQEICVTERPHHVLVFLQFLPIAVFTPHSELLRKVALWAVVGAKFSTGMSDTQLGCKARLVRVPPYLANRENSYSDTLPIVVLNSIVQDLEPFGAGGVYRFCGTRSLFQSLAKQGLF